MGDASVDSATAAVSPLPSAVGSASRSPWPERRPASASLVGRGSEGGGRRRDRASARDGVDDRLEVGSHHVHGVLHGPQRLTQVVLQLGLEAGAQLAEFGVGATRLADGVGELLGTDDDQRQHQDDDDLAAGQVEHGRSLRTRPRCEGAGAGRGTGQDPRISARSWSYHVSPVEQIGEGEHVGMVNGGPIGRFSTSSFGGAASHTRTPEAVSRWTTWSRLLRLRRLHTRGSGTSRWPGGWACVPGPRRRPASSRCRRIDCRSLVSPPSDGSFLRCCSLLIGTLRHPLKDFVADLDIGPDRPDQVEGPMSDSRRPPRDPP